MDSMHTDYVFPLNDQCYVSLRYSILPQHSSKLFLSYFDCAFVHLNSGNSQTDRPALNFFELQFLRSYFLSFCGILHRLGIDVALGVSPQESILQQSPSMLSQEGLMTTFRPYSTIQLLLSSVGFSGVMNALSSLNQLLTLLSIKLNKEFLVARSHVLF